MDPETAGHADDPSGRRTLIAGFGNVLLGDDGFGVEVVKRLVADRLPARVETIDVGICGLDFVLKLMEGFDEVIVVDAVRRGGSPGTIYVFRPLPGETAPAPETSIDPHLAEPSRAIAMAWHLGVLPDRVTVVGCEPGGFDPGAPLTTAVERAIREGVERIRRLINRGADDGGSRATDP